MMARKLTSHKLIAPSTYSRPARRSVLFLAHAVVAALLLTPTAAARPLYVVNSGDSTIGIPSMVSRYAIGQNGLLSPAQVTDLSSLPASQDPSGTPPTGFGKSITTTPVGKRLSAQVTDLSSLPASGGPSGTPPTGFGKSITTTPDGKSLYVNALTIAAGAGDSIYQYSINANGSLEAKSPAFVAADDPGSGGAAGVLSIAASPDSKHLYALTDTAKITQFDIAEDGTLGQIGDPVAAGENPFGIAITPDGGHLYISDRGSAQKRVLHFALDGETGQPQARAPYQYPPDYTPNPSGLAVSPDGRYLYVAKQVSGGLLLTQHLIGEDGSLSDPQSIATAAASMPKTVSVGPDGRNIVVAHGASGVISHFTVSDSGELQSKGTEGLQGTDAEGFGVAFSPDGRYVYAPAYTADATAGSVGQWELAGAELALLAPPSVEALSDPDGITALTNQGPQAVFTVETGSDRTVIFNAGASTDSDGGSVARYDWSFDDGTVLGDGGPNPSHTYSSPGTYTVSLTVTDNEGCSTDLVYTGQNALCNGSEAATFTGEVTVDQSPSTGPDEPGSLLPPVIAAPAQTPAPSTAIAPPDKEKAVATLRRASAQLKCLVRVRKQSAKKGRGNKTRLISCRGSRKVNPHLVLSLNSSSSATVRVRVVQSVKVRTRKGNKSQGRKVRTVTRTVVQKDFKVRKGENNLLLPVNSSYLSGRLGLTIGVIGTDSVKNVRVRR